MTFDTENEFYVKEAKDMVNIVHRLIADGKYLNFKPSTTIDYKKTRTLVWAACVIKSIPYVWY